MKLNKMQWMVLLIGFLIIGLWARDIRVNNIHTCEKYWNEDCNGYNVQTKECDCESGKKFTSKQMIEEYRNLTVKIYELEKVNYMKNKTKAWNEINLSEVII